MTMLRVVAAISIVMVSACTIGKSAKDFDIAVVPRGTLVRVSSGSAQYTGELVVVRDNGLVVAGGGRMILFPFGSMNGMVATELGNAYRLAPREKPSGEKLERLRLVSRFPQGMNADVERRFLAVLKQDAIVTIE